MGVDHEPDNRTDVVCHAGYKGDEYPMLLAHRSS